MSGISSIPGDLFVLTLFAVLLILSPPRMAYLSSRFTSGGGFSPDALGGAATGAAMALWFIYFFASVRPSRRGDALKLGIVVGFAILFFLLPAISDMAARAEMGLQSEGRYVAFPHDGGVLQTEAATGFLLSGANPYAARYGDTEMVRSHHSRPGLWRNLGFRENPAFGFFPYPPATLFVSVPFYGIGHGLLGWYDQRVVHIVAFILLGFLAYRLPRRESLRLPFLALVLLSPFHVKYFIEGYNDILCALFLLAAIFATRERHDRAGALLLGIACGLKQFAWLLVPLYLAYLYARAPGGTHGERARSVWGKSWPLFASTAIIFLPFLVWGPARLVHCLITAQGTIFPFRSGSLGLSNFLILFGLVESPRQPFPHWLFYLLLVLPVAAYGAWKVVGRPTVSAMLTGYAFLLFVFLFVSRFFAFNYLWLLFLVAACALLEELDAGS